MVQAEGRDRCENSRKGAIIAAALQPRRRASEAETKGHAGAGARSTGPPRTPVATNGGFVARWYFNAQFPDITEAAEGSLLGPARAQTL